MRALRGKHDPLQDALKELQRLRASHERALKDANSAVAKAKDRLEKSAVEQARSLESHYSPKSVLKLSRKLELTDRSVTVKGNRHRLDPSVRGWTDHIGNVDVEQGWVFKSQHDRRTLYLHIEGDDWHEIAELRGANEGGMAGINSNSARMSDVVMAMKSGGDHLTAAMQFAGQVSIAARAAPHGARQILTEAVDLERIASQAAYKAWYFVPDEVRRRDDTIEATSDIRASLEHVRDLHRCRKRSCVNPDHLEAVTHAENVLRTWLHRSPPVMADGSATEMRMSRACSAEAPSRRHRGSWQRASTTCRALTTASRLLRNAASAGPGTTRREQRLPHTIRVFLRDAIVYTRFYRSTCDF